MLRCGNVAIPHIAPMAGITASKRAGFWMIGARRAGRRPRSARRQCGARIRQGLIRDPLPLSRRLDISAGADPATQRRAKAPRVADGRGPVEPRDAA